MVSFNELNARKIAAHLIEAITIALSLTLRLPRFVKPAVFAMESLSAANTSQMATHKSQVSTRSEYGTFSPQILVRRREILKNVACCFCWH